MRHLTTFCAVWILITIFLNQSIFTLQIDLDSLVPFNCNHGLETEYNNDGLQGTLPDKKEPLNPYHVHSDLLFHPVNCFVIDKLQSDIEKLIQKTASLSFRKPQQILNTVHIIVPFLTTLKSQLHTDKNSQLLNTTILLI